MYLVIVGGGKVGHPLASSLINEGHEVFVLDHDPAKVAALREAGLTVRREPHTVAPKAENRDYLRTKAGKMGHLLD